MTRAPGSAGAAIPEAPGPTGDTTIGIATAIGKGAAETGTGLREGRRGGLVGRWRGDGNRAIGRAGRSIIVGRNQAHRVAAGTAVRVTRTLTGAGATIPEVPAPPGHLSVAVSAPIGKGAAQAAAILRKPSCGCTIDWRRRWLLGN